MNYVNGTDRIKNIVKIFTCFFLLSVNVVWASREVISSYHEARSYQANLDTFPKKMVKLSANEQVTIGDLHGNALKFLYFLIQNGIIDISSSTYMKLKAIYDKPVDDLTLKEIAKWNGYIKRSIIKRPEMIRFLGDTLCDRGNNDYFTLTIYKKLSENNVPFEIALSNHGSFFIRAYESHKQSFDLNPYGQGRNEDLVKSMLNLQRLIDRHVISKEEVIDYIENDYIPHVKAIPFTANLEQKEISLYSHAPIGLSIIENLAADLGITYDEVSLQRMVLSIKLINKQISRWLHDKNFRYNYLLLGQKHKQDDSKSPLTQLIWNRNYEILKRNRFNSNQRFSYNYIHGHDSKSHVVDLDTLFGKGATNNTGNYAIYYTN